MTDRHAEKKRLYAIDYKNSSEPWQWWEHKAPMNLVWEQCISTPKWPELWDFRRKSDAPVFDKESAAFIGQKIFDVLNFGAVSDNDNSIDQTFPDPGQHYRNIFTKRISDDEMQNGSISIQVDPAFIEKVCGPMTGMQFTILKKGIRLGTAHKDKRQDLLDIIGAAQRELELMDDS
jgi:hypothetical protein